MVTDLLVAGKQLRFDLGGRGAWEMGADRCKGALLSKCNRIFDAALVVEPVVDDGDKVG